MSSLKRVKSINPEPKRANVQHYRDVKAQTDWLRSNVLDAAGNLLYCAACIRSAFGISKQRIARQRAIKQNASKEPLRRLTKAEVEQQRLGEFVLMPSGCDIAFRKWWKDISEDNVVTVKYPYEQHGLARRVSNSAKTEAKDDFLKFVDNNSQPNGRDLNSYSPTHYFLPHFTTIEAPKQSVRNYHQRLSTSLTGEFNRAQQEQGRPTVSSSSVSTWLKQNRPKHTMYLHKLDYCDTCTGVKNKIQGLEMQLK